MTSPSPVAPCRVDVFVGARATMSSLSRTLDHLAASDALVRLLAGPALQEELGTVSAPEPIEVISLPVPPCDPNDELWTARTCTATAEGLADLWAFSAPDAVLIHGDRAEALAAASAATIAGVPIVHTQGGEVSGAIDNRVRAAISALATVHLPESITAAGRLLGAGADPAMTHVVGRLRLDVVDEALLRPGLLEVAGDPLPREFVLVAHHPDSAHPDGSFAEMMAVLAGAHGAGLPVVAFCPNRDPGAAGTRLALAGSGVRVLGQLSPEQAAGVLVRASALVGNSSAVLWEADAAGVGAVCVGERQAGRDAAESMVRVPAEAAAVGAAVREAVARRGVGRVGVTGAGAAVAGAALSFAAGRR